MAKKLTFLVFAVLTLSLTMTAQTGQVSIHRDSPTGTLVATASVQPDGTYSASSDALTQAVTSGIPVFAVYGGQGVFQPSTSPLVSDVVTSGLTQTSTTLVINPNPATVGQTQVFSGSVTAVPGPAKASPLVAKPK